MNFLIYASSLILLVKCEFEVFIKYVKKESINPFCAADELTRQPGTMVIFKSSKMNSAQRHFATNSVT